MHNHSNENEFNFPMNEISFSYEKTGTRPRFEKEAKGSSEMARWELARWTPDRVVRVQTLAKVLLLCSWVRHFSLTVFHST